MTPTIHRISERPDLRDALWDEALSAAWPTFMTKDPLSNLYYPDPRFDRYLDHALIAFDPDESERPLARALSAPFCLGEAFGRPALPLGGWDRLLLWADQDQLLGRTPNVVSAVEIAIRPDAHGRGLSAKLVAAMADNARRLGFRELYAPVRPSLKHLEPATPFADYVARTRPDGLPEDPWLRVHARAGAEIVAIAPLSMTFSGTLDDWRAWTGLPFDRDGEVVVPGALAPVLVSQAQGVAVYVEPNVWMRHPL